MPIPAAAAKTAYANIWMPAWRGKTRSRRRRGIMLPSGKRISHAVEASVAWMTRTVV